MSRVRIESKGSWHTTTVYVDGQVMDGVTALHLDVVAGERCRATFVVENVETAIEVLPDDITVEAVPPLDGTEETWVCGEGVHSQCKGQGRDLDGTRFECVCGCHVPDVPTVEAAS